MKAEIIAVGTEILTGQIVNTNAQYLSEKFAEVGIDLYFQTAVGDNEERLLSLLAIARQRSDMVVLCGGLGPTEDDLTKQTLATFLERDLVVDQQAMAKLDDFFASRPAYKRTPNNDRQAYLVEGSTPLPNPTGLAVGGLLEVDGVTYIVLPGPPSELKSMVQTSLLPHLTGQGQQLYSRVLRFFGIGESQLVTVLAELIANQTDPTLAPYAKTGEVTLRLSTKATSQDLADQKLDALEEQILAHEGLADYLYGYGEENSLAQVVTNLLKERQLTVTAAESLTGGLLQAAITSQAGSSAIFQGGFVTYSLEQKAQMLAIDAEGLRQHGVVSGFTAEKMAEQARRMTDSDLGVSLTGVAGPDQLEGQSVGTVYLGLATRQGVKSIKVTIGDRGRDHIRQIAVLNALNLIRQTLLSEEILV